MVKRKYIIRLKKLNPPIPFDNTNQARFMLDEEAFMAAIERPGCRVVMRDERRDSKQLHVLH
jgi:hypothetical protein